MPFSTNWAIFAATVAILTGISICLRSLTGSTYAVQSFGHVIIVTDKHLHPIIHAANHLAKSGLHVLLGVQSKDMLHFIGKDASKGVEVLHVDMSEPAHIAHLIFRSREIKRDLDRPLAGLIMLYPEGSLMMGLANGSLSSIEAALDMKRVERSWNKGYLSPMRLIQGALPLLGDPEEQGARVVILQPSMYLIQSLQYEDYVAHAAFMSTLDAIARDFLDASNISLSVITSTSQELIKNSESGSVTQSVLHAILSPKPCREYIIGSVDLNVGFRKLKLQLPLSVVRVMEKILPESLVRIIKGSPSPRHVKNMQQASNRQRHRRVARAKHRASARKKTNLNTYEHLAMKFA